MIFPIVIEMTTNWFLSIEYFIFFFILLHSLLQWIYESKKITAIEIVKTPESMKH